MLSTRKTPSYYDMLDCRRSGFTSSKCTLVVAELLDALVVDVVLVCKNEKNDRCPKLQMATKYIMIVIRQSVAEVLGHLATAELHATVWLQNMPFFKILPPPPPPTLFGYR